MAETLYIYTPFAPWRITDMAMNRVPMVGLLLVAAGCVTVQKVQPAEFIAKYNPTVVWVTGTDDALIPVSSPKMVGDTLKGTWLGQDEPFAIPLNEIKTVQAKMKSPKRTAILVTVLAATVGGVAYGLSQGVNGPAGCASLIQKGTPTDYCCANIPAGDKTSGC